MVRNKRVGKRGMTAGRMVTLLLSLLMLSGVAPVSIAETLPRHIKSVPRLIELAPGRSPAEQARELGLARWTLLESGGQRWLSTRVPAARWQQIERDCRQGQCITDSCQQLSSGGKPADPQDWLVPVAPDLVAVLEGQGATRTMGCPRDLQARPWPGVFPADSPAHCWQLQRGRQCQLHSTPLEYLVPDTHPDRLLVLLDNRSDSAQRLARRVGMTLVRAEPLASSRTQLLVLERRDPAESLAYLTRLLADTPGVQQVQPEYAYFTLARPAAGKSRRRLQLAAAQAAAQASDNAPISEASAEQTAAKAGQPDAETDVAPTAVVALVGEPEEAEGAETRMPPGAPQPEQSAPAMAARQLVAPAIAKPVVPLLPEPGAQSLTVALIDTGIDPMHPALYGRLVGRDDFTGQGFSADRHGTAVAAAVSTVPLIGSETGASDAELTLHGYKACQPHQPGDIAARCWTSDLIRALDAAIIAQHPIINMSVGGPDAPILHHLVQLAQQRGLMVVSGAGNGGPDGRPVYPAAWSEVLAVTAMDQHQAVYSRASQGRYIQLAAPGVIPAQPEHPQPALIGSSLASGYISGLVAQLQQLAPAAGADRITAMLLLGADDLGPPGPDAQFGIGRVNPCRTALGLVDKVSGCLSPP